MGLNWGDETPPPRVTRALVIRTVVMVAAFVVAYVIAEGWR